VASDNKFTLAADCLGSRACWQYT